MPEYKGSWTEWTCPKCGTLYKTPSGIRILAIVPEWDYCPKDGTTREGGINEPKKAP